MFNQAVICQQIGSFSSSALPGDKCSDEIFSVRRRRMMEKKQLELAEGKKSKIIFLFIIPSSFSFPFSVPVWTDLDEGREDLDSCHSLFLMRFSEDASASLGGTKLVGRVWREHGGQWQRGCLVHELHAAYGCYTVSSIRSAIQVERVNRKRNSLKCILNIVYATALCDCWNWTHRS